MKNLKQHLKLLMIACLAFGAFKVEKVKGQVYHESNNLGNHSSGLGALNVVGGDWSLASGNSNTVNSDVSQAFGLNNFINGYAASAFGRDNNVSGASSATLGVLHSVSGNWSVALGNNNQIENDISFSAGHLNHLTGYASNALGKSLIVSGSYSSALGYSSNVSGEHSIALGREHIISDHYGFTAGYANEIDAYASSALGKYNTVTGQYATALGYSNNVSAAHSVALGRLHTISNQHSFAVGYSNEVSGYNSSALGWENNVIGSYSTALGLGNTITENHSYVFGKNINNTIDKSLIVGWNGEASFFVDSTSVGIGTTSPRGRLDVNGDTYISGNIYGKTAGKTMKIQYGNQTGGPAIHLFGNDYTGNYTPGQMAFVSGGNIGTGSIDFYHHGTGNNYKRLMKLASNGKVSIGNNMETPNGYKLYVEDGILTEKVKVALKDSNGWADHVFTSDYDLLPLEDVETHIVENGHLHKQPSAEELVQDGGIELGEMAAMQQEKIEEIYLHLIDMNKELKSLKAENAALKSELENLKK